MKKTSINRQIWKRDPVIKLPERQECPACGQWIRHIVVNDKKKCPNCKGDLK